jgi:hypothetical protein
VLQNHKLLANFRNCILSEVNIMKVFLYAMVAAAFLLSCSVSIHAQTPSGTPKATTTTKSKATAGQQRMRTGCTSRSKMSGAACM